MLPIAGIGSGVTLAPIICASEVDCAAIEPAKDYVVAGWASVNEATEGPPIWDVVEDYLAKNPVVRLEENRSVKLAG